MADTIVMRTTSAGRYGAARMGTMFLTVVLGLAGTACDSDASSPTRAGTSEIVATPISPPPAAPTVEPTAAPVLQSTGRLIYLRGKDLYVGDLATGAEQRLTTDSLGAGYAGYARIGGELWLYYTSLTAITNAADGNHKGMFEVSRRQLGGVAESLFTFEGNGKNIEFSKTNASVSPDGTHIAYSDAEGLNVRDLDAGVDTGVLTNGRCEPEASLSAPCRGSYYAPQWSPRGDWLFVQKILYEGAVGVLIRQPATAPEVTELKVGGLLTSWSSDGTQLCMGDNGYQVSAVGRVDPDNPTFHDLYPSVPDAVLPQPRPDYLFPGSCLWSATGQIAVSYVIPGENQKWLAIFDADGAYADRIPIPGSTPVFGQTPWLPDGSGFIVGAYDSTEGRSNTKVLMLDGTYRRLPIDAERVLGTLSEN